MKARESEELGDCGLYHNNIIVYSEIGITGFFPLKA